VCFIILEALHSYFNIIPAITLNTSIPLISDIVDLPLSISFMTLGFSYFVNLQVLLSIWLFYLVIMARAVRGVEGYMRTVGLSQDQIDCLRQSFQE
jgi:hypothetical protein